MMYISFQSSCVDELVKDGENGRLFRKSQQLASILLDWFSCANKVKVRLRTGTSLFHPGGGVHSSGAGNETV